jgi:DNA-binding beta-propeller fold protein YncE
VLLNMRSVKSRVVCVVVVLTSVALHERHRVIAAEPALPAPRFLMMWGKRGTEPGHFHFPIGIAVNRADEVLVTDHYNNRIQKFDGNGKLLAHFSVLPNPGGIAIDEAGNIYLGHFPGSSKVKQKYPDRLSMYSAEGKLLHVWGKSGTGPREFDYIGGLALAPHGKLYVADQTNHRVQVLDRDGKFLSMWGKYGRKPGEFAGTTNPKSRVGGPNFLAIDSRGNVYTTESMNGRVQKFTANGEFISAFGGLEDKPGSFGGSVKEFAVLHGPVGICCDRENRLWISAVSGRIQQFTGEGKYLRGFGEPGTGPGQFMAPHALAVDSRGHLFIVDAFNQRIQKFDVDTR